MSRRVLPQGRASGRPVADDAHSTAGLDDLLALASAASPADRILLRDPIAAQGALAIEAMADWLLEPTLAAFAIRVLERIGRSTTERTEVIGVLIEVDRVDLPEPILRDLDAAMATLGAGIFKPIRRSKGAARRIGRPGARPSGTPGEPGRGYWVMRTSPGRRPYIWAQAQAGRLRQGWGWSDDQNLEVIAEAVRQRVDLTDDQRVAWRSRRMRTSAPDGMRFGDLVVAPNLPDWGRLCVFRVVGSYEYRPDNTGIEDRFGHILPVELLVAGIDRRAPAVSDGLRSMLRVQTRLYSIAPYGGDVERLVATGAGPING